MLYGHIDGPKHRIDHMVRLRELQDETGGFQTFIPLAFHPDNSEMAHIPKPSGFMDLKVMAISRLMLDNFPHIKAYWVMLGLKTAQVALSFGADDLDGTVVHEKIYHEAGAETPQEATVAEIERLITEAGRIPVERDTLYHRIERDSGTWTSREHIDVPALASWALAEAEIAGYSRSWRLFHVDRTFQTVAGGHQTCRTIFPTISNCPRRMANSCRISASCPKACCCRVPSGPFSRASIPTAILPSARIPESTGGSPILPSKERSPRLVLCAWCSSRSRRTLSPVLRSLEGTHRARGHYRVRIRRRYCRARPNSP